MGRTTNYRILLAGAAVFVAVGVVLHYVADLPAWASIAIPAIVLGAFVGVAENHRT